MTICKICKQDDNDTGVIFYNKNVCGRCYARYDNLKDKLKVKAIQLKLG